MRVIVLGGTRFIGRVIVETLTAAGHAVLVVHRGINEPADLRGVEHLHAERRGWPGCQATLAAFGADAAVDVSAADGPDTRSALAALPSRIALVARCPALMSTGRTGRFTAACRPMLCR
jgi:nucleoside-diphosphate-sugar epimerase